jgi:putative SbcD/Mre11-related phosphoesterase
LNRQTLLLADLHIGFESELSSRGISIPDQTPTILDRIINLQKKFKTSNLIILGDLKHSIPKISALSWIQIPRFMEHLLKIFETVTLVPGNHDGDIEPLLPRKVNVAPVRGFSLDGVWLCHGHTRLTPNALKCSLILAGHIHPAIQLLDKAKYAYTYRVWLRGRIKHQPSTEIITLPAFNDFVGQMILNSNRFADVGRGPIFSRKIVDIKSLEVESLDMTYLGKLDNL